MEKNIKAKEPWIGVLLNYIFAGFGELYAGEKARGFVIMGITILLLVVALTVIPRIVTSPDIKFNGTLAAGGMFFSIFNLLFCVFVLFDGYLSVRRYNMSNGVKASNIALRILSIVGIMIIIFINRLPGPLVRNYLRNSFKAYAMSSDSMKPTLQKKDWIIVDKKAYVKKMPQRQDVAVFIYPKDRSKDFISRIVGLPGESLEINNGKVIINGQELESKIHYYNRGDFGKEGQRIEIPQGSYYVLGDNSATSRDSRYWGFISLKDIKGKAIKIYWPLSRANTIE